MKESQKKRSHGEKRPRGRFMPGKVRITLARHPTKTIAFFEETVIHDSARTVYSVRTEKASSVIYTR